MVVLSSLLHEVSNPALLLANVLPIVRARYGTSCQRSQRSFTAQALGFGNGLDERVALDRGRMLRIAPESRRKLLPGPDGGGMVAIGASPDRDYRRPEGLGLAG